MLDRIADLTWRRPKPVLVAVVAFVAVAAVVGHDVEHHLKAAGFTDSASESERATELLRESLGYDATPGIVLLVRDRGGRLDRHAARRSAARSAASAARSAAPSTSAAWSTRSRTRAGRRR